MERGPACAEAVTADQTQRLGNRNDAPTASHATLVHHCMTSMFAALNQSGRAGYEFEPHG
jgi:hypothetical protein